MADAPGSSMPERGRQAAIVLLDALTGWAESDEDAAAMDLALERLHEVGAVTATLDDDAVDVDASHLVGGALVLLQWLINRLTNKTDADRLEVIVAARSFIDEGS